MLIYAPAFFSAFKLRTRDNPPLVVGDETQAGNDYRFPPQFIPSLGRKKEHSLRRYIATCPPSCKIIEDTIICQVAQKRAFYYYVLARFSAVLEAVYQEIGEFGTVLHDFNHRQHR
ncbi:hypothetical protein AVEN_101440-1 [Araneus ventricosus]|uniref:Uncharacterized protein n=1 Tax=Araneus ventricosus TaxID=182803 RepID=A0A4Y2CVA4_ARAVE|nr:hypothetical protein AVEN_101440-1 [Araneus ventricosus]